MASGNTKFYEILGISKNFSPQDLEKAYGIIYYNHHASSPGIVWEAYRAYEILRDPVMRQLYDQYGVKDVYDGDPPRGIKRLRQSQIYSLKVSLQELHNGTSKNFSISRYVMCYKCNGNGSKSGASMECSGCQGFRCKVSTMPYDPLYHPEAEDTFECERCNECDGEGRLSMDLCLLCKGKKIVTENKVFHVHVEKGMQIGDPIRFPGEADQGPDIIPGDIVFVLQLKH